MTPPNPAVADRSLGVLAVWPLFLGVLVMMIGNGLQNSLVGTRSSMEGFPTTTTGFIIAAYYFGFLLGAFLVQRVLVSVGHIRVFAAMASLASSAVLVSGLFVDPLIWILMRTVTGFAMAGLYITAESWLNARATNATRGRLMAVYMVMSMGGISIGQALLGFGDPLEVDLFVLASIAVSLALVPLTLVKVAAPELGLHRSINLATLIRLAPLGAVAGFLTGVSNGGFSGMITVYAADIGLPVTRIGLLAAMGVVGGLLLQMPLGHLSDIVPRRRVILAAATTAVLAAAWAITLEPGSWMMYVAVLIYGGINYPMYSLAVSHINDVLDRDQIVGAASAFMFLFGVGAILGPIITAYAMNRIGPVGYFWTIGSYYLPVAMYALWRIGTRAAPAQGQFISLPARGLVEGWTVSARKKSGKPRL